MPLPSLAPLPEGMLLWIPPLLLLLGVGNALHAIMRVPSPRGVVAWVFALVTVPAVAIPAYWIFGRYKFIGYIEARRTGRHAIRQTVRDVLPRLAPAHPTKPPSETMAFNARLAGLPVTDFNEVRLLRDGAETLAALHQAIGAAEHFILVQFFSLHDDATGRAFRDELVRAAHRGVAVHFLYDVIGCTRLPRRYFAPLREAGGQIAPFRSTRAWTRFQINFRNHRKITVIDGRLAFTGGLNIGDAYMGRSPRFGPWRDTHAAVRGPAVQTLQVSFLEDWFWATQRSLHLEWSPERIPQRRQCVLPVPTGPADALPHCRLVFLSLIQSARRRLWIATPYFVPDNALVAALQAAALRGVDVRILLPARPDHLLVYLSGFTYLGEMLRAGVHIYRYQPGFMHQKVILADRHTASIGSANLDNRSLFLNFELHLLVADPVFAREVATMLQNDFRRSRRIIADELDARPLYFRLAARGARILSPIQ